MAFLWFELKSASVDFFIIFNRQNNLKNSSIFGETEAFVNNNVFHLVSTCSLEIIKTTELFTKGK